ncbi:MAG: hypothetical protein C0436_01075 [Alphaproteobacteria bacterium]|nr:hypothetical protein [Alphaproteobacteria bacterium]
MTTTRTIILSLSAATMLYSGAALAQIVPQTAGVVTYVTGGIGRDETSALKAAQGNYNLHIMSSSVSGHFVGDALITISTAKGEQLLNIDAGPILLAKLPAGTYHVEATRHGETKKQRVTLGKKTARVNFAWKEAAEDTVTIRGEASTPIGIPAEGTTFERVVGTTVTEPPALPPAETAPAPVYQATPTY